MTSKTLTHSSRADVSVSVHFDGTVYLEQASYRAYSKEGIILSEEQAKQLRDFLNSLEYLNDES